MLTESGPAVDAKSELECATLAREEARSEHPAAAGRPDWSQGPLAGAGARRRRQCSQAQLCFLRFICFDVDKSPAHEMHGLASSSPPLRLPPSSSWLVPSPSSLNRRCTLPLLGALLCFFALLHAVVEVPDERAARLRQLFSLEPAVPKATLGADLSFTQYLDAHWPLERRTQQPHLWITLADGLFARTGAANLDAFVRQLNLERRRKYGRKTRETHLVTLCLDEPCVVECAQRDMYAYGGFTRQKPEQILCALSSSLDRRFSAGSCSLGPQRPWCP